MDSIRGGLILLKEIIITTNSWHYKYLYSMFKFIMNKEPKEISLAYYIIACSSFIKTLATLSTVIYFPFLLWGKILAFENQKFFYLLFHSFFFCFFIVLMLDLFHQLVCWWSERSYLDKKISFKEKD